MTEHSLVSKKVILITGASSGLGEAIAKHLSNRGHVVYGVSRNIQACDEFESMKMDVCNEENVRQVMSKIFEREGRIDIVINSAGVVLLGPVEFGKSNDILSCFNTNIIGSINTVKAALPYMRDQKSGLIINVSSLAAANGLPYRGYYSASKAAIEKLTESLRLELAPFGVQACFVEPGDFYGTNLYNNSIIAKDDDNIYDWHKTRDLISQLIAKGEKPYQLAILIESIINAKRVRCCYRIGKLTEKLSASLKNVLPHRLMEVMIKLYFKL